MKPLAARRKHVQGLRRRYLARPSAATRKAYRAAKAALARRRMATDVSDAGLAFIAREEGVVLHPYDDSRGFATVGVGHLIAERGVTMDDLRQYRHFTRADALALLRKDAQTAVLAVRRNVRVRLTQNQLDALVSLAFNIGAGAFAGSTVVRKLNAKDSRGAADAFRMWHVGGAGLAARRERERKLFLS